jgi:CBS domain-containing protein
MEIKELITKSPALITPETSIGEAAKMMFEQDIGSLFVQNEDKLVGVITDRDIVTRGLAKGVGLQSPVQAIMTEKVLYCFENDAIEDVAENLAKNQVHRMPVLDKNKRLLGVVSLGDLGRLGKKDIAGAALCGIAQRNKGAKTPQNG